MVDIRHNRKRKKKINSEGKGDRSTYKNFFVEEYGKKERELPLSP